MVSPTKFPLSALAAVIGLSTGFATAALASEPTPAPEGRTLTYSFNIGATSDYVFRGYAQNRENPSAFAGIDLTYGIGYFGIWAANVDFGDLPAGTKTASTEIDFYAGIKPVLGPITFDLGVIYYAYPGANDNYFKGDTKEQDYVELKGGASGAFIPMLPKLTLGGVLYYTNEYQAGANEVLTAEATAAYELPALGKFTPTVSALYGKQYGDAQDGFALANGKDELAYWNAGLTLAIEKFSFDFRYWDTDIRNTPVGATGKGYCNGPVLQCDERFVFTGKFTY